MSGIACKCHCMLGSYGALVEHRRRRPRDRVACGRERRTASTDGKVGYERLGFSETTHAQDAEADHMTILIDTLHDGVVLGLLLVAGGVGKADFQKIGLRVEPHFQFVGHKSSPAFGLSVR